MTPTEQKAIALSLKAGDKVKFFSAHFACVEECTFGMAATYDAAGNWNASTFRADGSRVTLWFGHDQILETPETKRDAAYETCTAIIAAAGFTPNFTLAEIQAKAHLTAAWLCDDCVYASSRQVTPFTYGHPTAEAQGILRDGIWKFCFRGDYVTLEDGKIVKTRKEVRA